MHPRSQITLIEELIPLKEDTNKCKENIIYHHMIQKIYTILIILLGLLSIVVMLLFIFILKYIWFK